MDETWIKAKSEFILHCTVVQCAWIWQQSIHIQLRYVYIEHQFNGGGVVCVYCIITMCTQMLDANTIGIPSKYR